MRISSFAVLVLLLQPAHASELEDRRMAGVWLDLANRLQVRLRSARLVVLDLGRILRVAAGVGAATQYTLARAAGANDINERTKHGSEAADNGSY